MDDLRYLRHTLVDARQCVGLVVDDDEDLQFLEARTTPSGSLCSLIAVILPDPAAARSLPDSESPRQESRHSTT
jgi:hypothetical protein